MTATVTRAPGVHEISEVDYHSDPALSSSGARKLLPPSCPALFKYEQENPPGPRAVFDIGHAAHKLALGIGPEIVELPYDSMRTNAAKDFDAAARAAGKVPLKAEDYAMVTAMAAALHAHPIASALISDGQPEASIFWDDAQSGVQRRARLDWLPAMNDGRPVLFDYKTVRSADPEKFVRSIIDYGYHLQGSWYLDAAKAIGFGDDAKFLFVCQEKVAPYLVTVIGLTEYAERIGRILNRRAIDIFAKCTETDTWPGYSDEVEYPSLPHWYATQFEENFS